MENNRHLQTHATSLRTSIYNQNRALTRTSVVLCTVDRTLRFCIYHTRSTDRAYHIHYRKLLVSLYQYVPLLGGFVMALIAGKPYTPQSAGNSLRKEVQTVGFGTTRSTLAVSEETNVNTSTGVVRAVVPLTAAFTLTMVEDARVPGTNITIRVRFTASLRLAKTRFTLCFDDEGLRQE